MVRPIRRFLLAAVLMAPFSSLFADGFPIKDGRYNGGPTLIIKLTKNQTEMIQTAFKAGMTIQLTENQKIRIVKETNLKISPTKIAVYHASDLTNSCTCFTANIGFDFKPGWLELPVASLCSDEEAEGRKPDPNG